MKDILVVGKKDTVLGFKSIGFGVLCWDTAENPEKELNAFIEEGTKIIFVTEDVFNLLELTINHYANTLYPMFISIPSLQSNTGVGYKNVQKLMIQALGTGSIE